MTTHDLKTWPMFFQPLLDGTKTFEVRKNDRDFKVQDTLRLREVDRVTGEYTGRETSRVVSYVLRDFVLIAKGYVVLGFEQPRPAMIASPDTARAAAMERDRCTGLIRDFISEHLLDERERDLLHKIIARIENPAL